MRLTDWGLFAQDIDSVERRAVITGLGIISPIGTGVERFWSAARSGTSGIGNLTQFDGSSLPPECRVVGEVSDFDPELWVPERTRKAAGRFTQFGLACAKMAVADSRLDLKEIRADRIHVAIGTSMSGLVDIAEPNYLAFLKDEEISPSMVLEYPGHSVTSQIAMFAGARGRMNTVATACTAGLDAIGWAADQIETGAATVVLAGGTETPLSLYSLTAFHAVGVLCKWSGPPAKASRPFDRLRNGMVLAEGAAVVVVEEEEHARARRARIYASIIGFAGVSEGVHLRKIDESGISDARVINQALERASRAPQEIDYIAAHGNSMIDYDAAETVGIKQAFGRHAWNVPISSLKSMVGQALGASGAMQVVAACLSLRDCIVPPTINYTVPDPVCDLDYVPNVARYARVRTILIHARSMGGSQTAMVLEDSS
jgi:3-oxoacyl-[acyl-carrier-protein] synthase II